MYWFNPISAKSMGKAAWLKKMSAAHPHLKGRLPEIYDKLVPKSRKKAKESGE